MKNKVSFLFLWLLLSLSGYSDQRLDISIEYSSKDNFLSPICFWIHNNTDGDIPNIEYILNDIYFCRSDLPVSGDCLELFNFAKRDGTRFDFFSVKPIELKVKSKKGTYSIMFDDIPYRSLYHHSELPSLEGYHDSHEIFQYYSEIGVIKTFTNDAVPATVIVNIELGYPQNDKTTPQELTTRLVELKDFLPFYFKNKTIAELKQEERIKIEIRNEINDNILSKSKIKSVVFTQYDIIEP